MDDNEQLLAQVPLFAHLPKSELGLLATMLSSCDVPHGAVLFREGEAGQHFYIVREGQIEVVKALETADERLISVRGPGEFVGEMSFFIRDGLRTASVRARGPTRLWEMTRENFDALLHRHPTLAYEMVGVLSQRLNASHNAAIRDLQEKNLRLTQAYEALQAAQAQIIEKEKLERELQLAREVQAALIPGVAPQMDGWDFAARWQPARLVSGDFYDFFPVSRSNVSPSGQGLGIVIGDVSGKGMPAALFMALTRSIVRATAANIPSPAECITQVNRVLRDDAANSMFVTLCYIQLNPATGDLTYVNAGHNSPLLYRADQGRWFEFARTGLPLGLFDTYPFTQTTVQLDPGDCLLLYTDGVTEAVHPQGQEFGMERLQRIVQERQRDRAAHVLTVIEQAINAFIAGAAPADDITIVLVKRL